MTRYAEFLAAHHGPRPLLLPNAWDHASAAALAAEGFTAIGTTSLGVAAAHGLPDGAAATRSLTVDLARTIAPLPAMISVDLEGGYSDDPTEVAALAAVLADLGIVGINLEDGRSDGTLRDPDLYASIITEIKARCPGLFINARTDTFWLNTEAPLDNALARAERYLDAGADGVFVPGATDPADIRTLAARIDAPLNVLYMPTGLGLDALAALGVARVSTGSLLYRAAISTAVRTACEVREGNPVPGGQLSYAEMQQLAVDALFNAADSGGAPASPGIAARAESRARRGRTA
ncbi:isocitrate lyase/phosphoenolpyruvate mutase family protein [Glycomyces scopariae]